MASSNYLDSQGRLTNGRYTIDAAGMAVHKTGSLSRGKSQFLARIDAESAVLDAAAYADREGIWGGVGKYKAKVQIISGPIGVLAGTGELTDYVNVYRTKSGFVHGSPGTPL